MPPISPAETEGVDWDRVIEDLLEDPSYNTRLASAYIADRRDEFGGSYILTLTGFNAGPGRTRQWLRQMGDPRRSAIDPFDWIYRIPFEETRLYVRKVLSLLGLAATSLPFSSTASMARASGLSGSRRSASSKVMISCLRSHISDWSKVCMP